MKKFVPLLVIIIGVVQPHALAQTSAELINRMSEATKKLDYEGVFVFSRGDKMDVMRILHKFDGESEREKITSLTGHAREIIRNGQTVTCIFPDTQEVMVERSRAESISSKLPEPIEAISDHYQFSTAGDERIAGRDTWVVSISPRDAYRYGYQLWIDKENHLLLKSELRDESGEPLEMVMFTQLEIHDALPDELFSPSITGREFTWYQYTQENGAVAAAAATEVSGPSQWQVTWMPEGFSLSDYDERNVTDTPLEHMIYSDGVSSVSIFIERITGADPANTGTMNLGGVNVYARTEDGYQVTAVGEVPQATVKRMVDSVVANR